MRIIEPSSASCYVSLASILTAFLFLGCQSGKAQSSDKPAAASAPAVAATPSASPATAAPAPAPTTIRINAGATKPLTDTNGNVWLPDQGFTGGETVDRGSEIAIAKTKAPALYQTEHYAMTAFSQPLPNGKYTVKLYFAETYDEITAAGQRVFSFTVEDQAFKDFDVFAKAGGAQKGYVETVNVKVADGKLDIAFTSQVQSPEINGIEIIPAL